MTFCPQCGASTVADAKFCASCGSPVTARPAEESNELPPTKAGPHGVWLVLVAIAIVGTYAALFVPALLGAEIRPSAAGSVWLWTALFFYLWWKRLDRKGWQGALIGSGLSFVVYTFALMLQGAAMGTGV